MAWEKIAGPFWWLESIWFGNLKNHEKNHQLNLKWLLFKNVFQKTSSFSGLSFDHCSFLLSFIFSICLGMSIDLMQALGWINHLVQGQFAGHLGGSLAGAIEGGLVHLNEGLQGHHATHDLTAQVPLPTKTEVFLNKFFWDPNKLSPLNRTTFVGLLAKDASIT